MNNDNNSHSSYYLPKYRSIFISDTHLGSPHANTYYLKHFLQNNDCKYLYLVGDIVDGWRFKKGKSWNSQASEVIQLILKKAKKTKSTTYLIGNHDEFLRNYVNSMIDTIHLTLETVHIGKNGNRYLVVHGDMFDSVTRYSKMFALFADKMYSTLIYANKFFNLIRRHFSFGYWSLSSYIKKKSKDTINFIFEYEKAISRYCLSKKYDGIICGHIHTPEIKNINDINYLNCGDWVESHTALVEHHNGEFEILNWAEIVENENRIKVIKRDEEAA